MTVRVVGPAGDEWAVQRRWLPGTSTQSLWARFRERFLRVARRTRDGADLDPGCGEVIGEGLVAALALILLILVVIFVVIPLVIALLELVLLAVLAAAILAARVVLRRPWVVEAVGPGGRVLRWDVVGWRASGDACETVARHLEAGIVPPPGSLQT